MLEGKCVVLGVSGGIAAYKAAEIVSRLRKAGARVRVVMTQNACRFVAPLTFETLSGNPVYVDGFTRGDEIEHIALAKDADLLLIAPATANVLAKIACGIADDLLTTTALAMPAPLLVAPAMNTAMYKAEATRENLRVLGARGVRFVGPESGRLACGDDDVGRMSEPETIVNAAIQVLCPRRDLDGRRVLVTAGPTREMLDPVRFLSNRSTGKMGYALAEAARARGAFVTLVTGPVALTPPNGVETVPITSTRDLFDAVTGRQADMDVIIQAAAPADFTPETVSPSKIKKTGEDMSLRLVSTPDVAKTLGERKKQGQILVAFAAETNDALQNARAKRLRKNADLIVLNDVTEPGAGFAGDTNRVTLIDKDGETALPLLTKLETADRILSRVAQLLL